MTKKIFLRFFPKIQQKEIQQLFFFDNQAWINQGEMKSIFFSYFFKTIFCIFVKK